MCVVLLKYLLARHCHSAESSLASSLLGCPLTPLFAGGSGLDGNIRPGPPFRNKNHNRTRYGWVIYGRLCGKPHRAPITFNTVRYPDRLQRRCVLPDRLSGDVLLPNHGDAPAGPVPERLRQGYGHQQRRKRGHGDRHGAAVCGRARIRFRCSTATFPAICCWGPRRTNWSANTWPTPRARPTPAKATSTTAMRLPGDSR